MRKLLAVEAAATGGTPVPPTEYQIVQAILQKQDEILAAIAAITIPAVDLGPVLAALASQSAQITALQTAVDADKAVDDTTLADVSS